MATENWKGVKVKFQLLTKGTRRYGETLDGGKPQFIVAHDTGNINTTAQANVTYYQNTYNIPWNNVASAHMFIDDQECIICIPTTEKAWHVLYDAPTDNLWYGKDANDVAIGVEICYFSDKARTNKALDNGARVLAYLAEYWGIDYKTKMPGHQDIQADKQDPGNALQASGKGRSTSNLDELVAKYYKKDVKVTATPTPKNIDGATKYTRDEFVKFLNSGEGKQYDYDCYAAFQCVDWANVGWDKLFGHGLKGDGAKDIPFNDTNVQNFKKEAVVYKNTPSFLAQPGDLVVWGAQLGGGWGHVAWVVKATLDYIVVLEQNWENGGWTDGPINNGTGWETVTRRKHDYETEMWFIRPNFSTKTATVALASKIKAKQEAKKDTWNWKGRFTTNTTIKVRRSPGLKGSVVPASDWLLKNQWVDFTSITKKDGYWWIAFKYPTNRSAGTFYCAICKITDKQQKIKNEKYWGSVKWK